MRLGRLARGGWVVTLVLLAAGCQSSRSETPAEPQVVAAEGAVEGSGDHDEHDDHEAHDHPPNTFDPRLPTERVADAVNVGRERMARAVHREIPGAEAPEGETTDLRLWVGGNVEGELEVCGCRRNPLGGLARRATFVRGEHDAPIFHVDAGNLLFEARASLADVATLDDSPRQVLAHALGEGLMRIGVDAVGVGASDLVLGGAFLTALEEDTDLPLLSGNLTYAGEPLGEGVRIVERGGVTVAFVGISSASDYTDEQWTTLGISVSAPLDAAASGIAEARATSADLVVLVSSMGVTHTASLVEVLTYRDAAPDLAVVSGTHRMLRDPVWAAGIPVYESGTDGKHVLRLDLSLAEGTDVSFRPREALAEDLMTYIRTVRMIGVATANRGRMERQEGREAQVARYDDELRDYYRRLDQTARQIQATLAARPLGEAPAPVSHIDASLEPVYPTIDEATDVRRVIDAAYDRIEQDFGAEHIPATGQAARGE